MDADATMFPVSFGKKKTRPKEDKGDDRRKREEEIAAITREMMSTKPKWSRDDDRTVDVPEETKEEPMLVKYDHDDNNLGGEAVPVTHVLSSSSGGGDERREGRAATCVDVDPSGGRFVVGTSGGVLKMYDFGGMDQRMEPFRQVDADAQGGRHGVVAISFAGSTSGDRFLCCTASAQPQIFDRDGTSLLTFQRGDPYVTDPTRTTGHTTTVTGGAWQPRAAYRVGTCGVDGSVRLWDLCGKTGLRDWLFCETSIRVKDARARKAAATAMSFAPDGRSLVCAANDGSLQFWHLKAGSYHRPDAVQRDAHRPGTDASGCVVSSVIFSPTGNYVASRSDDGFAKLWDIRRLGKKGAVAEFPLQATHRNQATANLCFSPSGHLLAAGNDDGDLLFFDVNIASGAPKKSVLKIPVLNNRDVVPEEEDTKVEDDDDDDDWREASRRRRKSLPREAISQIAWHPRLKQILVCDTAGGTKIMYSPTTSQKGALLIVDRDHTKHKVRADYAHAADVNQAAIDPEVKGALKRSTGYAKMRHDSKQSRKPDPPLEAGQQGRNAGVKTTLFQQVILSSLPESIRNQDPREALLKYADKPPLFKTDTTHYRDAEGKPIYDATTLDEAEHEFIDQQKDLLRFNPKAKRQKH